MKLTRILKGSRIAEIDARAISSGIDSKFLMKNAGNGVSKVIITDFEGKELNRAARGVVVCGSGNNGGDGFVVAGDLMDYGMDITVFHISSAEKISPDSFFYFKKLQENRKDRIYYLNPEDREVNLFFCKKLGEADFVVDAIFGTGLHGSNIYGASKEVIEVINKAKENNKNLRIYSIDIPSGVDSDDGKILGVAVKADKTITFGCKKIGLVNYPGADFAGEVIVIDIGIPEKYYEEYEQIFEPDLQWVADNIPVKEPWTYKYRVGSLLVIAGSAGLTGAATMTCMGALRAGAGVVALVCPRGLNDIFEQKLTEIIKYPVGHSEDVALRLNSLNEILELSDRFNALAIGPGLSKNLDTMSLVREILRNIKKPVVLDADGLYALYGPENNGSIENFDLKNVIITPHTGEMSLIMGLGVIPLGERVRINQEAAEKYRLTSVLKGARTIISDFNNRTFINSTGNWGLATAGTGDILTGIIGSLLCQGAGLLESAVAGVYIHGLAADILVKEISRTSLIATDLLEGIKKVFMKIEKIKYK